MRENFIYPHFATSLHCKIDSKAHFFASPPPLLFRPKISVFLALPRFEPDFGRFFERSRSFFALRSAIFSRLSPFQIRFLAIFRGTAPVFCPEKCSFFLPFPFQIRFRANFREIAPPFFLRAPLFAEQDPLSDSGFPLHSPPPPSSSPDLLAFRPSFLPLPSPLPTFSCIPPHFSTSLPN